MSIILLIMRAIMDPQVSEQHDADPTNDDTLRTSTDELAEALGDLCLGMTAAARTIAAS
jgi:hypothetical protein